MQEKIVKTNIHSVKVKANNHIQCRTNVLADYIEKLTSDVHYVNLIESQPDEYACKHIAMVHCILILVILVYMFIDGNSSKK